MAKKMQHFRLLDLPAELRLRVYELLFGDRVERFYPVTPTQYQRQCLTNAKAGSRGHTQTNLLQTCKLVHKEATPVFFDATEVLFFGYGGPRKPTKAPICQLADLEPAIKQLRKVEISVRELDDQFFDVEFWQPLLKALDYGRGLKEFKLHLMPWPPTTAIEGNFDRMLAAFEDMKCSGEVIVQIGRFIENNWAVFDYEDLLKALKGVDLKLHPELVTW